MELNEEQLFKYMKCPIIYDAFFNKNIFINKDNTLTNLIDRISKSFYLNLMNGKILSADILKRKWDVVCKDNNLNEHNCLEGLGLIVKLFRWASCEQLLIQDIDIPYNFFVKCNKKIISFKGEISTIALDSNNNPYLLITDFSSKLPNQSVLDIKTKYTLDCYAYHKMYNKTLNIKVHHVKTDKDYYTTRGIDDFLRLENTIKNVAISINNNLYFPRESVFCSNCNFSNLCKVWHG